MSESTSQRTGLGIEAKVSILVSVLVLCASGFLTIWCYKNYNRALIDEKLRELTTDSALAGTQFTGLVEQAQRDVRVRAGDPVIQAYADSLSIDDERASECRTIIAGAFKRLLNVNPNYLQCRVIGVSDNGRELIRAERRGEDILLIDDQHLQSKGGEAYFARTLQLGADQTYTSRINLNREFGRIQEPHVPVMRVSSPIYKSSGDIFGLLIINIDIQNYFEHLRGTIPSDRELLIADTQGEYLFHSDPARCFAFEYGQSDRIDHDFPMLHAMVAEGAQHLIHGSDQDVQGETIAVGGARITFSNGSSDSSLIFATTTPFAGIVAATQTIRSRAILYSLTLVIISTIVALTFAQSITRPLRRITRSVQSLARDGRDVDLPINANNEAGDLARAFAELIEQRSLAEECKKTSEAQFRMAVESAPHGMVMVNEQGLIVLVNPETQRLFGYERDELIGESIEILIPERFRNEHPAQRDHYMHHPEKRAMGTGRELFARRKDGGEFPVEIGLNPIHTRDGVFVLSTIVDITARMEHEIRIKRFTDELLRKNEELQQFAYIASHDLQEPLRKIQAFSDMLQAQFGESLGDDGQEYINRMHSAATRMRALIDDLLSYSRISTVSRSFESVDLNRVVKDVLSDLMVRLKETAGTVNVGELPTMMGDESQLRQLFQNLIGNALKFHPEGVAPIVDVEVQSEQQNASGDYRSAHSYVITVRDNGIGFDEKYIDRIFAPFQRLHGRSNYEGTGIGLAVCKKIIDRHNGSITATSAPGKGATFRITLPMSQMIREGARRVA